MQPQFDVLSDGWRQPGSAIKPVNYAIGIDDHTMTASTLFMDVVTNFSPKGVKAFTPTQADHLERGPVRLRSALQFSLNIPSIKAGLINGLDHFFERSKDFGLQYTNGAVPVVSMSIGTLEVHPIDLLGAYGAIANKGVRMPRQTIMSITDDTDTQVWPEAGTKVTGQKVVSPEAAYIVTDILLGNTAPKVNPFWAKWMITDGKTRRPAAYKTGTTNDNRDVHAYGYLAPPKDRKAPALAVGVWMGNSNNEPNKGSLSLDSSAPLWSAILSEISKGEPIANFPKPPAGVVTATVDAHTGLGPGPFTSRTIKELFIKGTVPTDVDDTRIAVDIDASSGLLWQEGCVGPKETRGFVDLSWVETNFPAWQRFNKNWVQRARRGSGVAGGPKGTRTSYLYGSSFYPFGRTWGGRFAPTKTCEIPLPSPSPCFDLFGLPCPSLPPEPNPGGGGGGPGKSPKP
jgi:penicillin-binding protein 1A